MSRFPVELLKSLPEVKNSFSKISTMDVRNSTGMPNIFTGYVEGLTRVATILPIRAKGFACDTQDLTKDANFLPRDEEHFTRDSNISTGIFKRFIKYITIFVGTGKGFACDNKGSTRDPKWPTTSWISNVPLECRSFLLECLQFYKECQKFFPGGTNIFTKNTTGYQGCQNFYLEYIIKYTTTFIGAAKDSV